MDLKQQINYFTQNLLSKFKMNLKNIMMSQLNFFKKILKNSSLKRIRRRGR